ncbi:ABC transporter ATP-binding protein [Nesterenkonia salmonea]|uniref:ABC transporter ATP-binding protein n=1 Tax=Nesterenkonia salmonea TaxID=1804987 RepID=A0A5R9BK65_9MICC|nr:ABC transporter ATP-binding protein [Nesterenkonia salmonea]TLQ01106.1 ABC transporter ATP-binding protein [Nesterenkonia salmonea]
MSRLLTAENLDISAGSGRIVHGIDFAIDRGERVGLIGESGSGKSLTCLSLMGLLGDGLSATGSLTLHGDTSSPETASDDLDLLNADENAFSSVRGNRMSMVFQEPMTALNPLMRVGDQVAEVIKLHRRAQSASLPADQPNATVEDRVLDLLDSVRIPEPARAARVYPHQMSGGQRQRVMLAMAMANGPELLLADEPTTALDVTVQKQVLTLMAEQVERAGSSLLFITHDLGVVSEVCDRVIIMRHGRIIETGPIDQVFTRPEHPYTRALLAASALRTDHSSGRLLTPDTVDAAAQNQHRPAEDRLSISSSAEAGSPAAAAHLAIAEDGSAPVFNQAESPVLEVRDLTRSYGKAGFLGRGRVVEALRGVSFDVAAGQRFGIVGESGCGKSTLLRLLTALDEPSSGSVRVNDQAISGQRERRLRWLRQSMQIVFQDPMGSLDPRMTVVDIITEPLWNAGRAERLRRAKELLEQVGLPQGAAEKYPHEFSGGQRQRIAIARALVTRPKILIADEAVSALDVSVRAQVLNLLDDLVDEYDLTMVFVSHDLKVVRHSCDIVAVMNAGRIVECGPADAVFDTPKHPYTAELAAAIPRMKDNVA